MIYRNLETSYYEEAIYVGKFRNHKRDGYGEMKWGGGKENYKGIWCNDKRIKGTMTLGDGSVYEGEWQNDVFHGKGRLTFKAQKKDDKGITFEGDFENGF